MRSKKGKTEENENIAYDNEIDDKKINYTDFLKDTEEIEAQIMQEEEERLKRRKEKMKKLDSIKPKALKEFEEKEHLKKEQNKKSTTTDESSFDNGEINKADNVKKKVIISSVVAVVFVAVYLIISFGYFSNRFLPSTVINGEDCSNKKVSEVTEIMRKRIEGYNLSIVNNGITVDELYGNDINLEFGDMDKVLQDICKHQKKVSWLKGVIFSSEPINTGEGLKYDTNVLNQFINSTLVLGMESTTKSVDAKLTYKDGKYTITPAVYGNEINKLAVENTIRGAVNSLNASIDINKADCFIKPRLTEDNEVLIDSCKKANKLIKNKIELNVTNDLFEIPVDIKKDWLTVDEEGTLIFDKTAFAKYEDRVDKSYSSNEEVREFKTFRGDTVKVTGGDYGTAINRTKFEADVEEAMLGGHNSKVKVEFAVTNKEIGDSYIEVDLSNQMLCMYVKGEQKLCTPVITGKDDDDHRTPEGVYRLKSKTNNGSVAENGENKSVKYWMSINGVIGICDASWKDMFGGDSYKKDGSEGSIYMLEDDAKIVYENCFANMPIVCYNHAIVDSYFVEDEYMNELMNLIANKPEIPVYEGEETTEETSESAETDDNKSEESNNEVVTENNKQAEEDKKTSDENNVDSQENKEDTPSEENQE